MKPVKVKSSYIIVLVLALLLGFVLFVGIYSYTNITRVVSDIERAAISDGNLVRTKNLLSEISSAENSVKTYGLTKNSDYLDQYYAAIQSADTIMDELMVSSNAEDVGSQINLDLMDSLIAEKFEILNSYLELQNDYRVEIALDKVISSIETKPESKPEPATQEKEAPEKKRGFIQRLLKPNPKPKKNEKVKIDRIDEEIKAIKTQESKINSSIVAKEIELILQDKSVTAQIDSIVYAYELAENKRIAVRSEKAAIEIRSINRQITVLFVGAGLLVLFVILLIVRYVKANNRFGVALQRAKYQAEQLAETKERFLNNMSHEIRTPMNAISGFIKQLAKSPLNKEQREQVDIINKSSGYLLHIVDEILIFNKLQNNQAKIDKRGFEIRGLLKDVHQVMEPSARKKGIEFTYKVSQDVPNILIGDPYKLNQILINVIGNAVKFTNQGRITIDLQQIAERSGQTELVFKIKDTGIGMTKEQQSRVFNEFEQAEVSTTRKFGGTGLGLSITNKLVQLLQGSISVTSEKGVGSSFRIAIPFEVGNESDVYMIRSKNDKTTKLKDLSILIVDDEIYNRKLLTAILSQHDVQITEVENGIEAVDEVDRNDFDIILMDTRMPVMDGVEATKKIRFHKDKRKAKIPVIAISAAVTVSDQDAYKAVGMNGFLPKPFKESQLIAEIGRVTGRKVESSSVEQTKEAKVKGTLDFNHLEGLSNGDNAFYLDMLQTFVETVEKGMVSMKKAHDEGRIEMVAEHAHRIASPCKHLSAKDLYDDLKQIENGIRGNTLSNKQCISLLQSAQRKSSFILNQVKEKIAEVEEQNK